MSTSRLACLAGVALLAACTGGGPDDTANEGGGGGPDQNCKAETGAAQLFFTGDFHALPDAFASANFGYTMTSLRTGADICNVEGQLGYAGDPPDGCPSCTWAFDLTAASMSVATGDGCQALGFADDDLDGAFDYAWGYAPTYTYDYAGTPLTLDQALMVFMRPDPGWFAFAFNYNERMWVTGDSENLEVRRPGYNETAGYVYYYYYTGNTTEGCD